MNLYYRIFLGLALSFSGIVSQAQCVISSDFTTTPPYPVEGTWEGGTTVEMCFTVFDYNNMGANWFHGVSFTLGPGWDQTTIVPLAPPASCDGNGEWAWYSSITGETTGTVFGPGFFYDSSSGGPFDGNPGNNFGDYNATPCGWTFCFEVTTLSGAACIEGASLDVSIEPTSDGESGSWGSPACIGDPVVFWDGPVLTCCDPPEVFTSDPLCFGASSGSIKALGAGDPPFLYEWSTGFSETSADTSTLADIPAGVYELTVTDASACVTITTIELFDPPVIEPMIDEVINVACAGASTGWFTVSAIGGTGPLEFSLDGGPFQSSGGFSGLPAGSYSVTVQDSNECIVDIPAEIIEENVLALEVSGIVDATCFEYSDGEVSLSASGGYPAYSFSVEGAPSQLNNIFGGLAAGDYIFSVEDDSGCVVTTEATIMEPPLLTVDAGDYFPVNPGFPVTLTPSSNAISVTSYAWSPEATLDCPDCEMPNASPLQTTTYYLTIVDGNGCIASDSTLVPVILELVIPNAFTPNGDGENDVFGINNTYINSMEMTVFNRWGEKLYFSADLSKGWDGSFKGREQELGTYLYHIVAQTFDGKEIIRSGTVTLLR